MINRIVFTFISKFLTALLGFFIAILVSKHLGAAGRGEQALFLANVTFFVYLLSVFGSESIAIMHARTKRYDYLWISYLWAFLVFIISSVVILFFFQSTPDVWHVISVGFLVSLTASNMSICIARERTNYFNFLQFLIPIVSVVFILARHLIWDDFTYSTYISSLYVSYGIVFVLSFAVVDYRGFFSLRFFWKYFISSCRFMFQYGFHNQLAVAVQLVSYRGCFYLIGFSHGDGAVGIYANSVSIAETIWIVSRSIGFVIFSRFINLKSADAHGKLLKRALAINILLLSCCFFVFLFIPGWIYSSLFGSEFYQLKYVILALMPCSILYGQSLLIFNYFSGTRKHYVNTLCNGFAALVLVVCGYLLIPQFGVPGAIVATTIGYSTLFVLQNHYLVKFLGVNLFRASFCRSDWVLFWRFSRMRGWTILLKK